MNIKNVKFWLELEGRGIVNYDGDDQKWVIQNGNRNNNNVSYAKKAFYRDEDGKMKHKLKISSDAIKKGIFKTQADVPNIVHNKVLLNTFISSPDRILRGYLHTVKSMGTLKRKGALTITDAIQTCGAKEILETCTTHQDNTYLKAKGDKEEESEDKANTYFKKENVGDIEYALRGSIDFAQLQFISCDQTLDRYGFNPDHFDIYKKSLIRNLPAEKDNELKKYVYKDSLIPELGIKLSEESVMKIFKGFLKKLLNTEIVRRSSDVRAKSLKIQLISKPIDDVVNNSNIIEIKTTEDIENIDFSIENFYEEAKEEVEL